VTLRRANPARPSWWIRQSTSGGLALVVAAAVAPAACVPVAPHPGFQQSEASERRLLAAASAGQLVVGWNTSEPGLLAARCHVIRSHPSLGVSLVAPRPGESREGLAAALRADPAVSFVEPNQILARPKPGRPAGGGAFERERARPVLGFDATDDPLLERQWHLERIGAVAAWKVGAGAGVVAAVVDTGVDPDHPDLRANLLPGANTFDGDDPRDTDGHGTHVAGLIAAAAGNGEGGAGVAPGARILPIRAIGSWGGTAESVAAGITYAVDHGARIVNLSLGNRRSAKVVERAVKYAADRHVILVASMGNDGDKGNPINYPAALQGVVAVGASDRTDIAPAWSSSGAWQDLAAPGVGIWSTFPTYECRMLQDFRKDPEECPGCELDLGYASIDGTSQAAPQASAALALLLARHPAMTPADAIARLERTARDLGEPGRDPHYGAGLLDLPAALAN